MHGNRSSSRDPFIYELNQRGHNLWRKQPERGFPRIVHGRSGDWQTPQRRCPPSANQTHGTCVSSRRVHADALVFTTLRGKPHGRRNALRAVHAAGDAAGLNDGREPVGLHDLRHSFVGLALAAGATLAETAGFARHANARVTAEVYAGLADDGREIATAKLVEAGFGR